MSYSAKRASERRAGRDSAPPGFFEQKKGSFHNFVGKKHLSTFLAFCGKNPSDAHAQR